MFASGKVVQRLTRLGGTRGAGEEQRRLPPQAIAD